MARCFVLFFFKVVFVKYKYDIKLQHNSFIPKTIYSINWKTKKKWGNRQLKWPPDQRFDTPVLWYEWQSYFLDIFFLFSFILYMRIIFRAHIQLLIKVCSVRRCNLFNLRKGNEKMSRLICAKKNKLCSSFVLCVWALTFVTDFRNSFRGQKSSSCFIFLK